MEKWLILAGLGALSILMWIAGGRMQPSPAGRPWRAYIRTRPPEDDGDAPLTPSSFRRAMRLQRCTRCGAWRVEGARCHDSRGFPRG